MRLNVLVTILLTLPVFAQASVASDIAALEQAKGQRGAQLPDF